MSGRATSALIVITLVAIATGCGPSNNGDAGNGGPAPKIAYVCERSVIDFGDGIELYTGTGQLADPVVHTEMFARDGAGRYSVRLLTRNGKALQDIQDPAEFLAFEALSARFESGFGAYIANVRDFSVRDQDLFSENYHWNKVADSQVVAGREAFVAEVRPVYDDRPSYMVWSDTVTKVPLKIKEFTASGALSSEMEVTAIEYAPDFLAEEFADLSFIQQNEVSEADLSSFANFELFEPGYLPAGFVASSSRVGSVSGFPVVVQTWTDGVLELMLTQYAAMIADPAQASPDVVAESYSAVGVERSGMTRDAMFEFRGTQVHLTAKLAKAEFATVLENLVASE